MNVEFLEEQFSKQPDSLLFARLADTYLKTQRLDKAIEICEDGLTKHPYYITGHFVLGKCYFAKKEFEQAEKEFQGFRTPDDNRKFTELYNVQRLTSNTIGSSSKVVITTIQRLYSMLKGEPEFSPEVEEESQFDFTGAAMKEALPVVYNSTYPPEYFDVIVIDECHRSIYTLWRQVLEYFDAFLLGLTATPAKQTFGFFNKNLVMEYDHERAVADGINVDFEVYNIRTKITESGSTIELDGA